MIRVEAIENLTLEKFDELKNIKRTAIEQNGKLFFGDSFECTKEMCDYLLGNNPKGKTVVKVIEVVPEVEDENKEIEKTEESAKETVKEQKKTSKKKKK